MRNPHPSRSLAKIARKCFTKKELAQQLKGSELAEAWRIKQIQNARYERLEIGHIGNCRYGGSDGYGFTTYYLQPQKLSDQQKLQIKPAYRKQVRRWPLASSWSFGAVISDRIKAGWSYRWKSKNYALSVCHTRSGVVVNGSRAASSYDNYYITIGFDLLRQEAVWIGGLLTIRGKADADKDEYPCQWLERRENSPGLVVFTGRITMRDHHIEDDVSRSQRKGMKKYGTRAPNGWVSRDSSIAAGNCPAGTDHFIQNRLTSYLQGEGWVVGNLAGAAIRSSLLLKLQRDSFTRRIVEKERIAP